MVNRVIVFIAEGFGSGKVPFAPGTWGSIVGVACAWALLQLSSPIVYLLSCTISVFVSIYISGRAEKILKKTDPGSIVIDEIIALPICWALPVLAFTSSNNATLANSLFSSASVFWIWMAVSFVLFRILDIWKPWPAYQIQNLHGGLGVTMDDVISALYTSAILAFALQFTI